MYCQVLNNCFEKIWFRFYDKNDKEEFEFGNDIESNSKLESYDISNDNRKFVIHKYTDITKSETFRPFKTYKLDEEFSSHRLVLTNVFGPRVASSIKVFMACLAGPADPLYRPDISLIKKFEEIGVPNDNIYMLLEKQCTPTVIEACLKNLVKFSENDDVLFVYIGGHGNYYLKKDMKDEGNKTRNYYLCTHEGCTESFKVLEILSKSKASEINIVIDSCYSGQFIMDFINEFAEDFKDKKVKLLASTNWNMSAKTGWRIVDYLNDQLFSKEKYTSFEEAGKFIANNLVTNLKDQTAVYYDSSTKEDVNIKL